MKANTPILEQSDEQILETAYELCVAYQLKRTLRYATERDFSVHNESVAEHVFALHYLAEYFLPLEDPNGSLSRERVRSMLTFHDFGEIPNGDVVYNQKTEAHEKRECEDAEVVFNSLPVTLQATARNSWLEYVERKTPEAHFAYALDKIEPMFELLHPVNAQSLVRLKFTYEMHTGHKLKAVAGFPIMRRFVDIVSKDMNKRGVFWTAEK